MPSKLFVSALALVAVLALVPAAPVQAAEDAATAEVAASDAAPAAPALSTEEPEWMSSLGEEPIGGLPAPCPGAIYQRVWEQDGCCSGSIYTAKAFWRQKERFYCEGSGWTYWYYNYQTKCENSCLVM